MRCSTERLLLRPWQLSDVDQLYELCKDEHVGPPCGWHPHQSKEESLFVLQHLLMVNETYAIILKETNQVIGNISLYKSDECENDDQLELGFWLGYPYWGKGYMKEACIKLINYAFTILDLEKVWCMHNKNNHNSKRVQEKCGFKYHHTIDKHYLPQLNKYVISIVNVLERN